MQNNSNQTSVTTGVVVIGAIIILVVIGVVFKGKVHF